MIKILLVDDDFLVRTYLSRLTDWEAHGYTIVGAAQDGEQALEMIEAYQPNIVITDISMPVMDGIALIRRLKEEKHRANIIVLSCHDDFAYVREAMKLGADEYVLKNLLTEDSMLALLEEIKKKMIQPLPEQFDPAKERNTMVRLLRGQGGELTDFRVRACMAVRICDYENRVALLSIEQQERFESSFLQVCQELLHQNCIVRSVHMRRELYAVAFDFQHGESEQERRNVLQQAANTLAHNADRYLAAELIIGIADLSKFEMQPSECWNHAVDALEESFYKEQTISCHWQAAPVGKVIPQEAREFCQQLAQLIERRDGNAVRDGFFHAVEAFEREHTQAQLVREWVMQCDRNAGVSVRPMPQTFAKLTGMEKAYLDFCEELLPDVSQYSEPVAQIVRFLQQNYMNNLSLNDAADEVHLNAAYLSFIFHKETGITFSEYLVSCRINRAKELLTCTREKIKEVGLMSGYNDNRHFCKIFKRETGMTPQEYRKQHRK